VGGAPEDPREGQRQLQARNVTAALDRVDALARDTHGVRELLLRPPTIEAKFPDPVAYSSHGQAYFTSGPAGVKHTCLQSKLIERRPEVQPPPDGVGSAGRIDRDPPVRDRDLWSPSRWGKPWSATCRSSWPASSGASGTRSAPGSAATSASAFSTISASSWITRA